MNRSALDPAALERALQLRDLTDERQGTHALQQIVELAARALRGAWPEALPTPHRESPIVDIADNYYRLGYRTGAIVQDARYTRYVDRRTMLRSHTTAMIPGLLRRMSSEPAHERLLICPGIVYRRDSIDRLHCGEPHQLDLWRVRPVTSEAGNLGVADLQRMIDVVTTALLPAARLRTTPATHPYTEGGLQIDVQLADGGAWIEIGECGLADRVTLATANLHPRQWSGLAMGLGLDRLLMLRKGIPDIRLLRANDPRIARQMQDLEPYREVAKTPRVRRDLSVVVGDDDHVEDLGDRVRAALAGDAGVIEEVSVQAETRYASLPDAARMRLGLAPDQKNVLVRVVLCDPSRSLTNAEANALRDRIYAAIHEGPNQDRP